MRRIPFAAFVLLVGGCPADLPPPEPEAPPELTAELARAAMIDLIRSPDPGALKNFPLELFEKDGVEGTPESPSWGPFNFDLGRQEYRFMRTFGEPPRVCQWSYRGEFKLRDGKWVADPPRLEWQALGPGK